MRYKIHLVEVITLNTVLGISKGAGWLTAVSSSLTISRSYNATRNRQIVNSTSIEKKPLDTNIKNILCYYIGNSGYFSMRGYKPVDMPPILLESEIIDVFIVHTRKTVSEEVFPCIVVSRKEDDTTAFKFYISGEYNLATSTRISRPTERIVGRFLFVYENDLFYCDALAEEPAFSLSRPEHNVEQLYLEARNEHEIGIPMLVSKISTNYRLFNGLKFAHSMHIAINELVDPLCRLNVQKKLRICTIVMNSNTIVSQGIHFFPDGRNVGAVCERRQVLVRRKENAQKMIGQEEWMMACKAKRTEDNVQVEYYLSRAYHHSQVFVYTVQDKETGGMILENLSSNVRLVVDRSSDKSCIIL